MQSSNPFLEHALSLTRKEARNIQRIVKDETAAKEEKDEATLGRIYLKREKLRQDLFRGAHPEARGLFEFLRLMNLQDAPKLIEYVKNAHWLLSAPDDDRHYALRRIGFAMAALRMRNGLPPFDDGLPGEKPKAFEIIKGMLKCR